MAQQQLSLVHLIREPSVRTADRPPLLLLLHGIGSHEGDLIELAPHLDARFFAVSARAPLELGLGSYGWFRLDYSTGERRLLDAGEPIRSRDAIATFLEELLDHYQLDRKQAYLMGFSQGASLALGTALHRPDLVAGLVAMSGRLLPQFAAEAIDPSALQGLPVMVVHGTEDRVLGVENARDVRDFLEKLPVELTYREFQMGHEVTAESLKAVDEWLTAHLDAAPAAHS